MPDKASVIMRLSIFCFPKSIGTQSLLRLFVIDRLVDSEKSFVRPTWCCGKYSASMIVFFTWLFNGLGGKFDSDEALVICGLRFFNLVISYISYRSPCDFLKSMNIKLLSTCSSTLL